MIWVELVVMAVLRVAVVLVAGMSLPTHMDYGGAEETEPSETNQMSDGGGAATRGFVIQAMVALLDSLGRNDWSSVTVEPDLPSEKVDIQWKGRGTTERHSQVKNRSGGIDVGHARSWAEALRRRSPDAECVLHLVGPVSRGVVALGGRLNQVRVEVCGHDLESIRARCRATLHAALDQRGLHGRSNAVLERGVDRLAGILVVRSADKFKWSPERLWEEVRDAVAPEPVQSVLPPAVRWSQTRIIEIESSGDCVETHITTYVNQGTDDVAGLGAIIRVTDSENTTEQVWDSEGEPEWKGGLIGVAHTVWVKPRGLLLPGGTRQVGVRVRRHGCADVFHPSLHYADSALPPEADAPPCPVSTWVLLPARWHGSSIQAPKAELVLRGAVGFLAQANRRPRFRVQATSKDDDPAICEVATLLRHLTRPDPDPTVRSALRGHGRVTRILGDVLV